LIADEVGSLIHTIGAAIGETSTLHGTDNILFLRGEGIAVDTLSLPELEVALNPQTLRIVTHMAILYGVLSPEQLEGDELYEDENVLVAYIQFLRAEGKRDNVPVYAARLQRERCISVLSQTLQDVDDAREQREYLALLQEYNIDVIATMIKHLNWALEKALRKETNAHALRILERTEDTKLYPGRSIKVDFLPEETDEEDDAIVHSLSWFRLYKGGWKVTFDALSLALRKCLGEF
jgi:nuclear pore complex protein Nup107